MTDILENLIQSKVKRKLLKLFLFNKNMKYHTRELSRVIDEPISAVQRELKKLVKLQIIIKFPEGNMVNYFVNTQNPFYPELKSLLMKTITEPKDYFKLLVKTKSLHKVALFGTTVKQPMDFSEPVNLLVVGELDQDILTEYLKTIMELFNRDYALLYYSPNEFEKLQGSDKELKAILKSKSLIFLKDD